MRDCIFCKIAAGEIGSQTIYEDAAFRAILDIGPASRGHVLILPKEHAEDFFALPEETAAAAMKLASKLAKAMRSALDFDGLNVLQNNGEAAGQTVKHYHLHLIPRYEGDAVSVTWPQGSPSAEELKQTGKLDQRGA